MELRHLPPGRGLSGRGPWTPTFSRPPARHTGGARGREAHELLGRADEAAPLAPEDLERLAVAAYMLGLDDQQLDALARAHDGHLRDGDRAGAVRAAFWLGVHLIIRGEVGRATGWLGRARRLLEHEAGDCVERGYLSSADALRYMVAGDWPATRAAAADAVGVGERFGDPDLVALGLIDLGRALIEQGPIAEGLGKLDEAMVAAAAGELSPVATGFVYCSVIEGCHATYELARAREWTVALTDWCAQQPDLVPFTGTCLVHRAEILQIRGAWDEALAEARLACRALRASGEDRRAAGEASYRCGEILRRPRGPRRRRAARSGTPAGTAGSPSRGSRCCASRRAGPTRRARGDHRGRRRGRRLDRARPAPARPRRDRARGRGARRRRGPPATSSTRSPGATGGRCCSPAAAQARGAVELAGGDARAAAPALRHASRLWLELEAPYEAARARLLVAEACRSMGDARDRRAGARGGARRARAAGRGDRPAAPGGRRVGAGTA